MQHSHLSIDKGVPQPLRRFLSKTWSLIAACIILTTSGPTLHGLMAIVLSTWIATLATLTSLRASKWNSEVFDSIGRNKKIFMAHLRGIQRCLDHKRSSNMAKLGSKLFQELELLLDQEELLWKQKSKINWINFGDRNTSYFHSKAKARTRKKAIQSLKLVDSEWCTDHERLRAAASSYFASMFDADDTLLTPLPFVGFSRQLPKLLLFLLQ
ncbi:hypothetical protein V6N13_007653 [Hibiscus sabdariffa]